MNIGMKINLQYRKLMTELALVNQGEQLIEVFCDNRSFIDISDDGFKKSSNKIDDESSVIIDHPEESFHLSCSGGQLHFQNRLNLRLAWRYSLFAYVE